MIEGIDPQETGTHPEPVVLGETAGVVAVAKPAGLATQAPAGLPSVESWLRGRLPPRAYVGVLHRLDRAVSGVLLLAITPRAARKVSRQFERREISKRYRAVVAGPGVVGVTIGSTAEWRDLLVKIPDVPQARIADDGASGAREAITQVRFVGTTGPGALLVGFEPITGRMHQLRVQSASRGMPIVGDVLYGSMLPFGPDRTAGEDGRGRPIALHASEIAYTNPDSGIRVTVAAPLPPWWPAVPPATASS